MTDCLACGCRGEGVGVKMKVAYEWLLDPEHVAKPEWVKVV